MGRKVKTADYKVGAAHTIVFNRPQMEASRSNAQETFLIGGVGLGKSFFLGVHIYRALSTPGSVHGLFAPTQKTLKNSTLAQVQACWNRIGFFEYDHYVVNKHPPAHWGVKPYSSLNNSKILTTAWGSYAILDGLENYDSQRGIELDEVFIDEFRDVHPEARQVLLGRLRGKAYKALNRKHRIWYATTPPQNPFYLKGLFESNLPEVRFVFGTTLANRAHLPEMYINALKETYDERTYRREVLGELLVSTDNLFAYAFDAGKHVAENLYDRALPVYLSFDFNVNPMTCVIVQMTGRKFWIVDEFAIPNADVAELCRRVLAKYGRKIAGITGDSSGRNRSSLSLSLGNHFEQIVKSLGVSDALLQVSSHNPEHASSQILVNSILQNHPSVLIDAQCKGLINDLQTVQMKGNSIDKSDLKIGHLLDGLRYAFHAWQRDFISIQKPY